MNLMKAIYDHQKLSVGEHSLEEVLSLATSRERSEGLTLVDKCPDCGGNIVQSYKMSSLADYDIEEVCFGCGNTWSS
jgi:hypothetical protein